jgi:hypothetical protein
MNKPKGARLITQGNDGHNHSARRSTHRVLIVAVPPVRTLDVFGPMEVFGDANRSRSGGPIYEVSVISGGTDRDVPSHVGRPVRTDQTYCEHRGPIDTLLVAGFDGVSKVRYEQKFLNWARPPTLILSPTSWQESLVFVCYRFYRVDV